MVADNEPIVPEDEPMPIIEGKPQRQRGGGRFLHLFLYILTSLIFGFFLVLGGRWVYHKTHNHQTATKNPAPTVAKTPAVPSTPQPPASTQQNNKSSTPSTTPVANTPAASQNQTAKLPNNGPGDMVGVFVGVSLAVAGLHYVLSSRNYRQRV